MEVANLNIPGGYMSFSKMISWENSIPEFTRRYIWKDDIYSTDYMMLGAEFADAIQYRKWELLPAEVKAHLVLDGRPEYRMETFIDGIPTVLYMDTYNEKTNVMREYKCTLAPWTVSVIKQWGQVDLYAEAVRQAVGEFPKVYLQWFGTTSDKKNLPEQLDRLETDDIWELGEYEGKNVRFTGESQIIEYPILQENVDAVKARYRKAAEEISEAYSAYQSSLATPLDPSLIEEYKQTAELYDGARERMNRLKEEKVALERLIMSEMALYGMDVFIDMEHVIGRTKTGRFSFRKR